MASNQSAPAAGLVPIIIQRPDSHPFGADELRSIAAAHPGLSFATNEELTWTVPSTGEALTLHVLLHRIWATDSRFATDEGVAFLKQLTRDLGAEGWCNGESLTNPPALEVRPARFVLALLIAGLKWLSWRVTGRPKL